MTRQRNTEKINPTKEGDGLLRRTVLHLSKQINPQRAGITIMRMATIVAAALFTTGGLTAAERAQASITHYELNIPRQPLDTALKDLAQQTGLQVGRFSDAVNGDTVVGPVTGNYSADQALKTLLAPTRLTYRALNQRAIIVLRPEDVAQLPAAKTLSDNSSLEVTGEGPVAGDSGASDHKSVWSRLHLAQSSNQTNSSVSNSPSSNSSQTDSSRTGESNTPVRLEEIIVSAEKREESSLDVPMSLTALSGDQLARSQSYRLEDFVGKIPGLTLISDGPLGSQLVIRGLTTGSAAVNSSVATYIDETPYTAVGPWAGSSVISPNLDTFDMQRIEVLRGPQGTLYGANALGGLLKYVSNAPDPSGFEARVETGGSYVFNGGAGFDVHGMVNVPLADNAALRVVGYTNYYPGFIDDPSRGVADINGSRFTGFRAGLLYRPTANLSFRLNAFYQNRSWDDYSNEDVNPGTLAPIYGNRLQERLIGQPGDAKTQLYNLTMNWDLEVAKLVSSTSYSNFRIHAVNDLSIEFGPLVGSILGVPSGFADEFTPSDQAFTQEVRLSASGEQSLQWQVGGFFTNQSGGDVERFFPVDAATRTTLFNNLILGAVNLPVHYREFAGFADLDYHITPTVDVDAGGRYSENHQTFHETGTGIFGGVAGFGATSSQGVATYSTDVRWRVIPDNMLYARIASGFVPGGPNSVVATADVPPSYSSSTTVNYEAGIKSSLLDHHFTAELSVFHIDWRKIQLQAVIGGLNQFVNGGTARSDGVEWNFAYLPINGLTLNFNGAYTHAYLTQATPASVNGEVGDRLPAVPLVASAVSAEYERSLFGDYSGFAGADWRFTGSRYSNFTAVGPRQNMPSFNIFDLRAGVKTRAWTFALYAKNVGNRVAINYVQPEALSGGLGPQSAVLYAPRTVGATITADF
jgi:outer membrane receptor protein involved in Fe transport